MMQTLFFMYHIQTDLQWVAIAKDVGLYAVKLCT